MDSINIFYTVIMLPLSVEHELKFQVCPHFLCIRFHLNDYLEQFQFKKIPFRPFPLIVQQLDSTLIQGWFGTWDRDNNPRIKFGINFIPYLV